MNYAIRITLPYEDCKDIISKWADRSARVVVYQHNADEEISKTHIHLALYGCEVKGEALKRMWNDCPGKGNEFWSWKDLEPLGAETRTYKYITYMSKGTLRPVFVKNFSQDILDNSRQEWVEPVKADRPGDYSEKIIRKIMDKFNIDTQQRYHRDEDEIYLGQCRYNIDLLFEDVRDVAWKTLWGEHRRAPQPWVYKQIATTAFVRLCEDNGCFSQAVLRVQDKWY